LGYSAGEIHLGVPNWTQGAGHIGYRRVWHEESKTQLEDPRWTQDAMTHWLSPCGQAEAPDVEAKQKYPAEIKFVSQV
jgi:hypothetical protein